MFLNGLPVGVIELKSAAADNADLCSAFNQLQTCKQQIPSLFHYNEVLIASDGLHARIGSLTANREWLRTAPRSRSSTKVASPNCNSTRPKSRGSIRSSRRLRRGEEEERRERLKTRWAALAALVGAATRLRLVARDLVDHFEHRLEGMDGKAMVVCMSRRIRIDLYN